MLDDGIADRPRPRAGHLVGDLGDYVTGVHDAGRWIGELAADYEEVRDDWEPLVTRAIVWTRQGAQRRILVGVPADARSVVAHAAKKLQSDLTTVAAARAFGRLYRSRVTQGERTLLLEFLLEGATHYCSNVGSAERFRMAAALYRLWSARHLQADRHDPAAEGAAPGWTRTCSKCGADWRPPRVRLHPPEPDGQAQRGA